MSNSTAEIFGALVHVYTRAEALADGYLVAAPADIAAEVGIKTAVAVTRSVFEDCVAWYDIDGPWQEEPARWFDLLYMAAFFAKAQARNVSQFEMELHRIKRGQVPSGPQAVRLKVTIGGGDNGEPVITIMHPDED